MIVQTVTFRKQDGAFHGTWKTLPQWISGTVDHVELRNELLTFTVAFGGGAATSWRGSFSGGDSFSMTWIGSDGVPVKTRLFRRASRETLTKAKVGAPKVLITRKLPLPPLQILQYNGLAARPPMGWNSWNSFKERIDDRTVRETADALVQSGLRDAGYTILTIDDGWQGQRDSTGALRPNSKFPDMRALADYVHSKGLKFGIYSSPGPLTCAAYLGSYGHEADDVRRFTEWGVDFLKYDWCSAGTLFKTKSEMQALYQKMGAALQASGRPIIYSLCQYGAFDVGSWGRVVGGNLWRTGGDSIEGDRWATMSSRFDADGEVANSGPGGWNDPDMMLVGVDGLTIDEYRTHMTLWAMLAAPLIIGNDVRSMPAYIKDILTNKEVLQVDQDLLGKQGARASKSGTSEVWLKPLHDGTVAIALFNRGEAATTVAVRWGDIDLQGRQRVKDLWKGMDLGTFKDGISMNVPRHGSVLLKATGLH